MYSLHRKKSLKYFLRQLIFPRMVSHLFQQPVCVRVETYDLRIGIVPSCQNTLDIKDKNKGHRSRCVLFYRDIALFAHGICL